MKNIFKLPEVRKKIFFTLLIIAASRLLAHVPVPGVNLEAVRSFLQGNVLFGLFDLFSGGGFQNFSIITLGLAPYINVSIIIQIFTLMIPALEELQKEGEYGREKINMYTRLLTVPMALVQSYGIYFLLSSQQVLQPLGIFDLVLLIVTLTVGSLILVWLGELITEYGIGNGISLLIFASIISRLPAAAVGFLSTMSTYSLTHILLFVGVFIAVIVGVVLINEGTRNIVIEYGRRGIRSQKVTNYLPLKVNQAGVIPIIFAVSVIMVPSLISAPLQASSNVMLNNIGFFLARNFAQTSWPYNVLYFLLVFGFTFFYTFIQFNPQKIADDVKKRGGFIPGIRPGKETEKYLRNIVLRITLGGGLFLGLIAILPFLVQNYIGISNLSIGGTGLLIVVSVVLETIRQLESLTVTRSYETFLR
jgi:preprotein translocase subunit SecY